MSRLDSAVNYQAPTPQLINQLPEALPTMAAVGEQGRVLQINLSMFSNEFALLVEDETRIEELATTPLWNGPSNEDDGIVSGCSAQCLGRLRLATVDIFCVGRKALVGVGAIEHLRQHDEICAFAGSLLQKKIMQCLDFALRG